MPARRVLRHAGATACALVLAATLAACGGDDRDEAEVAREIGDPVVVTDGDDASGGQGVERAPDVGELDELPEAGLGDGSPCGPVDELPTAGSLPAVADTIVCLVNAERTTRGLRALRPEARLTRASRDHAADMVRRLYFAHDSRDGRTMLDRVKATGYLGRAGGVVGENLGWGRGVYSTPASIVDGWMDSPGHRANILRRHFRDIGIGVILGSPRQRNLDSAVTVATDFGRRGRVRARRR